MNIDEFLYDTYLEQNDYKSFRPIFINKEWTWQDTEINVLLEKASRELGGLNSLADFVPDMDVYINAPPPTLKLRGGGALIDDQLIETIALR